MYQQITPAEFQTALRWFGGPLATCEVIPSVALPDQIVNVKGQCAILGEVYAFEAENINLREIGSEDDILRIGKLFLSAFAGAEKKGSR